MASTAGTQTPTACLILGQWSVWKWDICEAPAPGSCLAVTPRQMGPLIALGSLCIFVFSSEIWPSSSGESDHVYLNIWGCSETPEEKE